MSAIRLTRSTMQRVFNHSVAHFTQSSRSATSVSNLISPAFHQSTHLRYFRSSSLLRHGEPADPNAPDVSVTFIDTDGSEVPITAKAGQSILDIAHENGVELEGACEASLACSTCHVILPQEYYSRLPEPSDEENDMLDMAFGLTDTSRLGCQVKLSPELEGMRIEIPRATRNMMVDKKK